MGFGDIMARVPNTDSIERIVGLAVEVKPEMTEAEQRRLLADIDRQVAVGKARRLDKNGNYEEPR